MTLHEPTLFISLLGFTLLSTGLLITAAANRDALVRYGGEEFLLMLDEVGAQASPGIAERLRSQIEQAAA